MMFLPYRATEKAAATTYMVDVFKLAFPEKVAKEIVAKKREARLRPDKW